jgi:hypothetical protein
VEKHKVIISTPTTGADAQRETPKVTVRMVRMETLPEPVEPCERVDMIREI